jgi:hypothetical protein
MSTLLFCAQFIASKTGKAGLTDVTVNVDSIARADGTRTAVKTGVAATAGRSGYYFYRLADATPATHDYIAIFNTADATVDQQDVLAAYPVADAPLGGSLAGYASGTAGAALNSLGSAVVTVVNPLADDGATVTLVYGDDYYTADGRALTWTSADWPVVTGATIALRVQAATVVSIAGSVLAADEVQVEISSTNVASLGAGAWHYDLQATLSNGHVVTLATGTVIVQGDVR